MSYKFTTEDRQAIVETATRLGIDPGDLTAVMAYESRGMNPDIVGGAKGAYRGLIQFGPSERKQFGYQPGMSVAEQVRGPVARYLAARGLKPGMGIAHLYSIINAGSLDKNGQPRWNARDQNGTIREHVQRITKQYFGPGKPVGPTPPLNVGQTAQGRQMALGRGRGQIHSGPAVRQLQQQLAARGFDLGPHGVDGRFGKDTAAAVRAAEKSYGLDADRGVAGPQVQAALAYPREIALPRPRPTGGLGGILSGRTGMEGSPELAGQVPRAPPGRFNVGAGAMPGAGAVPSQGYDSADRQPPLDIVPLPPRSKYVGYGDVSVPADTRGKQGGDWTSVTGQDTVLPGQFIGGNGAPSVAPRNPGGYPAAWGVQPSPVLPGSQPPLTVADMNAEPGGAVLDARDRALANKYGNVPYAALPAATKAALNNAGLGERQYEVMRAGLSQQTAPQAQIAGGQFIGGNGVPGFSVGAAGDVMRRTLEGGTEGALGQAPGIPPAVSSGINQFDYAPPWQRNQGPELFGGPNPYGGLPQQSSISGNPQYAGDVPGGYAPPGWTYSDRGGPQRLDRSVIEPSIASPFGDALIPPDVSADATMPIFNGPASSPSGFGGIGGVYPAPMPANPLQQYPGSYYDTEHRNGVSPPPVSSPGERSLDYQIQRSWPEVASADSSAALAYTSRPASAAGVPFVSHTGGIPQGVGDMKRHQGAFSDLPDRFNAQGDWRPFPSGASVGLYASADGGPPPVVPSAQPGVVPLPMPGKPDPGIFTGGHYDPLSSAYVPFGPVGDQTIAPAGDEAFTSEPRVSVYPPPPGGGPYYNGGQGPMARAPIGTQYVGAPPQAPRSIGSRIATGMISAGANALVPGLGFLAQLIGNSASRGSFDNAQPYRGPLTTGGRYAEAAPNPYGGYSTGSSYSASPFTPAGSGWRAPSFSPVSGGALYSYNPETHQYVDSQGRTHSYD